MKTEELLKLGVSKEQADSILAINGRDIERTKSANEQERSELARLKEELLGKEKELERYLSLNVEELLKENEELKLKAQEFEASALKVKEQEILSAEKEKLFCQFKARSAEVLDALIDWEKVGVKDGIAEGLTEQLDIIKEKHGYLFESDNALPYFSVATGGETEDIASKVIREAMGI